MEQHTEMSTMESVRGHLYGSFQNRFLDENCSRAKKDNFRIIPKFKRFF